VADIDHQHRTHLGFILRVFDNQIIFSQYKITDSIIDLCITQTFLLMKFALIHLKMEFSKFSCMLITITTCFGFVTAVPERFKFPKIWSSSLGIALSVLANP
jgi:hypothetical protein